MGQRIRPVRAVTSPPGGRSQAVPRLPAEPEIDVVVIGWNEAAAAVQSCLATADAATGVDVHPYFLDNGSDSPTPSLVGVHVERSDVNLGVAAGRNHVAQMGSSPLLCFLDADALVLPDTLRLLTDAIEPGDVGLAAPVFVGAAPECSAGRAPSLARKVARLARLTDRYARMPDTTDRGPLREVEFAIGACTVVRRDAFEAVGGFDESYFYGPEDVDLCLRLRAAGWKIVQVLDAECEHDARRSWRGMLTRRGRIHAWAVVRHLWRHRAWRRRP